jgi:diguanylate cyclase (GGDEF)-like protein
MTACLASEQIQNLIRPVADRLPGAEADPAIREVVTDILSCAESFVPCEAGSLMLSDPDQPGALVFVASFGAGASKLPGTVLPPGKGIAGRVFASGKPLLTNAPSEDTHFYGEIDKITKEKTTSLLSVPLRAFGRSVGVINLLNRKGGGFEQKDLDLLNIFCSHLTQSFQLLVEAKKQREASIRDHLTGLFNDRYLYSYLTEAIGKAIEEGTDLGVIFLDLDHFKSVVDSHGHLVGSQALREVGVLIGEVSDRYQCIPARYGGDEYVVVIPQADHDKVSEIAEELRKIIEVAVLECEGEDISTLVTVSGRVTASVGAVRLRQLPYQKKCSEAVRQLMLRVADDAMYEAKALGKNRVHFHGDPGHV